MLSFGLVLASLVVFALFGVDVLEELVGEAVELVGLVGFVGVDELGAELF